MMFLSPPPAISHPHADPPLPCPSPQMISALQSGVPSAVSWALNALGVASKQTHGALQVDKARGSGCCKSASPCLDHQPKSSDPEEADLLLPAKESFLLYRSSFHPSVSSIPLPPPRSLSLPVPSLLTFILSPTCRCSLSMRLVLSLCGSSLGLPLPVPLVVAVSSIFRVTRKPSRCKPQEGKLLAALVELIKSGLSDTLPTAAPLMQVRP